MLSSLRPVWDNFCFVQINPLKTTWNIQSYSIIYCVINTSEIMLGILYKTKTIIRKRKMTDLSATDATFIIYI